LQQLKNRRYYYCLFSMATKIQAVSFQYFTWQTSNHWERPQKYQAVRVFLNLLILYSHLSMGLARGLFPSDFPPKILCHAPAIASVHVYILDWQNVFPQCVRNRHAEGRSWGKKKLQTRYLL
jgi:hypothetical protein